MHTSHPDERPDHSSTAQRLKLPFRKEPHWHLLEYGRHIGYQKRLGKEPRWIARFRTKDGNYRQSFIGFTDTNQKSDLTFENAVEAARAWYRQPENSAIASDARPAGARDDLIVCPVGNDYSVCHAFKDYVEWKRVVASRTHFFTNLSLINYHIIPRIGNVLHEEFTGIHLREFAKDVLETPAKRGNQQVRTKRPISSIDAEALRKRKKTLNTLIGVLRMAFKLAWENGRVDNERAWRCLHRIPNVDRPRMIFLTRRECTRLLDVCRRDLRRLVLGALYTGCRSTELKRMRVADVAREGYGVYVSPSKSYYPRFVFLADEGMHFFLQLCKNRPLDEPVFIRDDGSAWKDYQKVLFRDAVAAAGLPKEFVFHCLRHTYASQLVQAGTPLSVVADQLGHASTVTVSRTYGHLAPQIREAEVRQRFAPLYAEHAEGAVDKRSELDDLREHLHGDNWRSYATITEQRYWPRSNFFKGDADLVSLCEPNTPVHRSDRN